MMKDIGIPYKGVFCGKLRRYFSWENFLDVFKIPVGILQAFIALVRFRPKVIFCKGGYVSFPVAFAGWMTRIPVILHESDVVPGLSNKLSAWFATKVCVSFEESRKYFSEKKVVLTGNPVRKNIGRGDKNNAREFTGLKEDMPVIMVMGGSQGAAAINDFIWNNLSSLLEMKQVVHICGKGNVKTDEEIMTLLGETNESFFKRYKSYEFVGGEMKDLYALADLIVSRAGAITLAELSVVKKPAILIPLGTEASRGDQIDNAKAFINAHKGIVMKEGDFDVNMFFGNISDLLSDKLEAKKHSDIDNSSAAEKIISLFEEI